MKNLNITEYDASTEEYIGFLPIVESECAEELVENEV